MSSRYRSDSDQQAANIDVIRRRYYEYKGQTGRPVGRQLGRQAVGQTGRQADRQTGKQAGREAGRQAGRQLLCSIVALQCLN